MHKLIMIVLLAALCSCTQTTVKSTAAEKNDSLRIESIKKQALDDIGFARKALLDSIKRVPASKQDLWYSAADLGLSPGVVHDYWPGDENAKEPGPYFVTIKSADGKLKIHTSTYKVWIMIHRGDVIK